MGKFGTFPTQGENSYKPHFLKELPCLALNFRTGPVCDLLILSNTLSNKNSPMCNASMSLVLDLVSNIPAALPVFTAEVELAVPTSTYVRACATQIYVPSTGCPM